MVQFDGLRPARLKVGIISAGRVGTAVGVALSSASITSWWLAAPSPVHLGNAPSVG